MMKKELAANVYKLVENVQENPLVLLAALENSNLGEKFDYLIFLIMKYSFETYLIQNGFKGYDDDDFSAMTLANDINHIYELYDFDIKLAGEEDWFFETITQTPYGTIFMLKEGWR